MDTTTHESPVPEPLCDGANMAAYSYACSIAQMMGERSPAKAALTGDALDQLARMKPRDPLEEMLISQMLMTHARLIFLNRMANGQKNLKWSELMHTAADRAANTFRRQMEALAKYRQPKRRRTRTSITTIRTAHIHAKQIVAQTQSSAIQPVRDESAAQTQCDRAAEEAIAEAHQEDQTVAEEHGPKRLPG